MVEETESGAQVAVEAPKDNYVLHSEEVLKEAEAAKEAPSDGEKPEEKDTGNEAQKKKPGGYVRKLNRAEALLAEKDAENVRLQQELEKLRPKPDKVQENSATKTADGEPAEDQFDSYGDYIKAWTKWDNREAIKQFQVEQDSRTKESRKAEDFQSKVLTYQEKVAALAENDSTYNPEVYDKKLLEVMQKGLITKQLEEEILDADNAERVTRHLLDHPEELILLRNLDDKALTRAITKLDARFENQGQSVKVAKTTKSPPPISPVKSNSSGNNKSLDELPYEEYKREMDKRDRESRR